MYPRRLWCSTSGRIRVAFRRLLNFKACGRQVPFHFVAAKEHEVDRNAMPPPLVEVNDFCADMKGQEKQPPRLQNPPEPAKRGQPLDHAGRG